MKNHGFTLLELIVTIALAAILLTLAVPSMNTFMQNHRIAGQTNDLLAALNLVRSEAVKRNRQAWLCPSQNIGTADPPTCSGGTDWAVGWLALVQAPGGTEVVRVWPGDSIRLDNISILPGASQQIRFESSGQLSTATNDDTHSTCPDALCLEIQIDNAGCRAGEDLGFRRLTVSRTGSIRVETQACT